MPHSVLEAIKMGMWDYEPEPPASSEYQATEALPGTNEKLSVLAQHRRGLPLWHPEDRRTFDNRAPRDD